jgi:hypothetical protein
MFLTRDVIAAVAAMNTAGELCWTERYRRCVITVPSRFHHRCTNLCRKHLGDASPLVLALRQRQIRPLALYSHDTTMTVIRAAQLGARLDGAGAMTEAFFINVHKVLVWPVVLGLMW